MAASTFDAQADATNRCCICLDSLDAEGRGRQWLPCGHVMHERCIVELRRLAGSGRCPLCQESHVDLTPVQALSDQAALHFMHKEHEKAMECCVEALNVDPENATGLLGLANWYMHQGDFLKAQELMEKFQQHGNLQFGEGSDPQMVELIQGFKQVSKADDPMQFMEILSEQYRSGNPHAGAFLGGIFNSMGFRQEAMQLMEDARSMGVAPSFIDCHLDLDTALFPPGSHVRIHGLSSAPGLLLNGQCGRVMRLDFESGRFGVKVAGSKQLKAIKGKNLTKIGSSVDEIPAVGKPQSTEDFAAMFEDLPAQTAIEESMVEMHNSQDVGSINAQVSNALVRSSPADDGPRVVLLKFSRPSSAMRQSLLEADELASCRTTLESHGLPVELASGAKIFVRPNNYDPALTAIR